MSTVPSGQRKRVRLGHDERRASILATARSMFCARPYAQVSMSDIAASAGVARGLLNHYFGSKRDLYLEVVREMVRMPPMPERASEVGADVLWERSVSLWLDHVEATKGLWVTAVESGGIGHDAELERIGEAARELVAVRVLEVLGIDPETAPPQTLALVRSFGGLAREASLEWLGRGRLTRAEAQAMIVGALPLLLEELLPDVLDHPGDGGATGVERATGSNGCGSDLRPSDD
ncbi:MAG: helix-turn-helix domain-containing protein [Actinomycetota bacterium]|nr:helix-turn-helix domain-containing protein [Actinomycetota bacterium]